MLINLGLSGCLGCFDAFVLLYLLNMSLNSVSLGLSCIAFCRWPSAALDTATLLINLRIRLLLTLTSLCGKDKSMVWRTYSSWVYVAGLRKGSGGFCFMVAT